MVRPNRHAICPDPIDPSQQMDSVTDRGTHDAILRPPVRPTSLNLNLRLPMFSERNRNDRAVNSRFSRDAYVMASHSVDLPYGSPRADGGAGTPSDALRDVLVELQRAIDLESGEAVLDRVSEILGMPLPVWSPDMGNPYFRSEPDLFARSRGWPPELLELWWDRNAALKMPLYIRCRFEHVPFLSTLRQWRRQLVRRTSSDEIRVIDLMEHAGAKTLLTIPLHLPKGRVAMVAWAGNRDFDELNGELPALVGDLLGIGHYFMKIADQTMQSSGVAIDERSSLTPREWDCLRTLAQGYREAEIAELNGISKVTVRFHLDNVVRKFGCRTRAQAAALGAQLGMLGPIGA